MSKRVTGYTITPSQFIIIVSYTTLALLYVCIFLITQLCASCILCFLIVCITSSVGHCKCQFSRIMFLLSGATTCACSVFAFNELNDDDDDDFDLASLSRYL